MIFFFLSNGIGKETYSGGTCLEGLSREVVSAEIRRMVRNESCPGNRT